MWIASYRSLDKSGVWNASPVLRKAYDLMYVGEETHVYKQRNEWFEWGDSTEK